MNALGATLSARRVFHVPNSETERKNNMKKLSAFILILSLVLAFAACGEQEPIVGEVALDVPQIDLPYENIPQDGFSQNDILQNPFEAMGMPDPFIHYGGTEYRDFFIALNQRLSFRDLVEETFQEYLEMTNREYWDLFNDKTIVETVLDRALSNCLMESSNIYSAIILFDIPNEIVLEALMRFNDRQDEFAEWSEVNYDYFMSMKFTDDEIEAFLSRDVEIVMNQFATEHAIIINDKFFTPFWIYINTSEAYAEAGITLEMIQEKLPLYAEFSFTAEATLAFEKKLSEFLGRDVVLANERVLTTSDALTVLRAATGITSLTDAEKARFGIVGELSTADALRVLRIAVGLISSF